MNSTYFIINGIKYIISCNNNQLTIIKSSNNKYVQLNNIEKEKINYLLNRKNSYEYNSDQLINIINNNSGLESKDSLLSLLQWLENIIPEEYRQSFYRNLSTLKTTLNINLNLEEINDEEIKKSDFEGKYDTKYNTITISKTSLLRIWKIALSTNNPQDFYWKHYSQALLHELTHMASTIYNEKTDITKCGFDTYPPQTTAERNRGLTEGYTECISMIGIPGTIEVGSEYYIECLLVNQLATIIDFNVLQESYFGNKGTMLLEKELCKLISSKEKAFELFRNIEINYQLGSVSDIQNILGNIQSSLLDYLEEKIKLLAENNELQEINRIVMLYEKVIITPQILETMKRNPNNYEGIEESILKFQNMKDKYIQLTNTNTGTVKK